jgi:hypothetical protein
MIAVTKAAWWERLLLRFCRRHRAISGNKVLIFKELGDKIFIIAQEDR